MRKYFLSITVSCIFLMVWEAFAESHKFQSDTLLIKEAGIFCEVDFPIHGIAFDNQGLMYVGGHKKIYTITPDKKIRHFTTLEDTTGNTMIWNLRFGPDKCLFAAAKDRVLRISPTGEQNTILNEQFPGPCGVSDLRFDNNGQLFVAYDNIVAKYDTDFQKQIIIDGSQFNPPLKWIVGLEFSDDFTTLYLGDCNGKQVLIVPYLSPKMIEESQAFPTNWGQYFTQDDSGNVYLTSLGRNSEWPEFVMLTSEDKRVDICCEKRVLQNRKIFKKTLAWGQEGFNENAIYCIIGNSIYEYDLSETFSEK